MNDRPPVPADLRRRILVEAGHRCAIHTCKHPEVDVHHIIPWEQCRKHEYDNLLALCPNCHRRADAGEIDRRSLRLYKARLVASFGLFDVPSAIAGASSPGESPGPAWRTETIRENYDSHPSYEVELEFPFFTGADADFVHLNTLEHSDALRRLGETRALRLAVLKEDGEWFSKLPSTMTSSYEISCCTKDIISIRHTMFHYGAGAAHPNHWTAVTNVQLQPLIPLELPDLFKRETPFLKTISDFCVLHLSREKAVKEPTKWILDGAGPDLKNFTKFNVTRMGLLITFDEYQVDCYAAGRSQVLVARSLLADYLNPQCFVSRVWTDSPPKPAGETLL